MYYLFHKVSAGKNLETEIPFEITEEKPTFFRAYRGEKLTLRKLIVNAYWWWLSKGCYRVWCAWDGDKVIHTSYVVPSCFKFPFLGKEDVEIGPSQTDVKYRGKGIFPAVLQSMNKERSYTFIRQDNYSSCRGVAKAGFSQLPGEVKKESFGRWVYYPEATIE